MTQGEYPYPPDEFDAVDPSAGPQGVHRRPRSRWAAVWPFLLAALVSAALAFAVVALVWDERSPAPATAGSAPEVPATQAPAEPAPTEPAPAVPETPPSDPAPVPVETPAPAAEPDLATPVVVYNSTSVPGLAAEAADQLEDAGWSEVAAGNYPGGTLPGSTVFYASADLETSARAVAQVLGIDAVEQAESDASEGIEVVLERDFAG